jgi:hypothetical protein
MYQSLKAKNGRSFTKEASRMRMEFWYQLNMCIYVYIQIKYALHSASNYSGTVQSSSSLPPRTIGRSVMSIRDRDVISHQLTAPHQPRRSKTNKTTSATKRTKPTSPVRVIRYDIAYVVCHYHYYGNNNFYARETRVKKSVWLDPSIIPSNFFGDFSRACSSYSFRAMSMSTATRQLIHIT